jgi:hypothetical protein
MQRIQLRRGGGQWVALWKVQVRSHSILAAYGAPAVGGFVVVTQMLKEYGSCAQLY